MRTTLDDFLQRAKAAHGDRYDYSKVIYQTTEIKVEIICKEHGPFLVRPRAHYTDMVGCPNCLGGKKSGFSYNSDWALKSKTLYFLEIFNNRERFVKIGVSSEPLLKSRFQKGQLNYAYNIIYSIFTKDASVIEREIKKDFERFSYSPKDYFKGYDECFDFKVKNQILKRIKTLIKDKLPENT